MSDQLYRMPRSIGKFSNYWGLYGVSFANNIKTDNPLLLWVWAGHIFFINLWCSIRTLLLYFRVTPFKLFSYIHLYLFYKDLFFFSFSVETECHCVVMFPNLFIASYPIQDGYSKMKPRGKNEVDFFSLHTHCC